MFLELSNAWDELYPKSSMAMSVSADPVMYSPPSFANSTTTKYAPLSMLQLGGGRDDDEDGGEMTDSSGMV